MSLIMDATQNILSPGDRLLCCRACLSTDARLFNIHEYNLADAFADIIGSPVAKDTLPQYLCAYCGTHLLKSAAFRDMCYRTQQTLTTLLHDEKLDLDRIRKMNDPSNQFLELTLTEVFTIECVEAQPIDVIKEEPKFDDIDIFQKPNINIAGVIKKTGTIAEFENQKRVLNISDDKLKYIKNRVKRIQNTIKKKIMESKNKENDVASIAESEIKIDIDIEEEAQEVEKKTTDTTVDTISGMNIVTPLKRQLVTKKDKVAKQRIDVKTLCKVEKVKIKKGDKLKNKVKRKIRNAENNYLPEFDIAKFESAYAVKIVILSKEEQLEEIALRKKSQNYLELRFRCEPCGKGYHSEAAYNNHLQRHNPSEGEFACEICSIRYKRRCYVQGHQDAHRLKLVCNTCQYVSRSRTHAKFHYQMHEGKTYQCPHCGKIIDKKTTYFSHLRVVHPALCAACDQCGETFVGEHGLRLHKKRAHAENSQKFKCPTCSANFYSVEALNRHAETAGEHIALRPCEQCGENCASEAALHTHVAEKHPKETHRCEECDISFPTANALGTHHARKHLNKRPPAMCKQDLAAYAKIARRRARLRPALAPSQPCVCEQCGHVVKDSNLLRYHQQRHLESWTFGCAHCPKSFALRSSLVKHLRTHTGEKHCPLAYSEKKNKTRARAERRARQRTAVSDAPSPRAVCPDSA